MAPRQARHSSGRAGRSWDSRSAIRSVYRSGPTVRQRVPVPQDGGVLGEIAEVSSALRRATRRRSAAAVLAVVLLTAGCTSFAEPRGVSAPRETEERPVAEVVTSAPGADLTVVADADLVTTAVRTSEALFDSAQLVVVAREGDPGAVLLGAPTAV